jgi:hypothetical protein
MDELAALAIRAHGGLSRWQKLARLSARQRVHGMMFRHIAQRELFNDTKITIALHRQWASHAPFAGPALRSSMEPQRVAIESVSGQVMAERLNPRLSFGDQHGDAPMDTLQIAYFIGYAMWMSLTTPFNFAMPGVYCSEIAPWDEYGECWRRLRVRYPPSIASHCDEQVFYFDDAGLLQRHDYNIDVAGGIPVADYVATHNHGGGIVVPASRVLLQRMPDNTALAEPSILEIGLGDILLS